MISLKQARMMEYLPKSLVNFIANKIFNKYLNKYAEIEVEGMEKLQNINKPVIFVCNHLSNADGLILRNVLKEYDVTFVAGAKLSNNPITNLCINIAKTIAINPSSADKDAMKKIIDTVKMGNNIVIFPEGTRSRVSSMINGKKGILLIAKLTKATIIPLGIYGTEKLLPISDSDMSSEKFNHAKVNLNVGNPIELPVREKEEGKIEYDLRTLNYIMQSIAVLIPEEYRGVYKAT
jgi:1-acyl-sn-glycerol-3-phosphate acyltransferase